jgi:hypothetical protein
MKGMVLCIVSTLAMLAYGSPEPAAGHLRAASAAAAAADATAAEPAAAIAVPQDLSPLRSNKIMADIIIVVATPDIRLGAPSFDYHDVNGKGGSGCGSGKDKCSCTGVNNAIQMKGTGTSGTLTGLVFACGFSVDGRDCKLYLEMPFWHSQSTVTWDCSGYELIGQNVPSGKVISQKMMISKGT